MASARPLVAVHKSDASGTVAQCALPSVFLAPIRPDIVHFVHTSMNKNHRQAYAVAENAGHQHSAESWGTGRAVSRIPRVSGGGTSRSGQAAFGNMCRAGRMFAPTKTWRRWHRRINTNQKRYAVASSLAASALPSLVLARGHAVSDVPEIPLVLDNSIQSVQKTKQAVAALKAVGAYADVEKSAESRKLRAGVGKMRNRRHVQRRGPLVVYAEDQGIVQAFRNLPGVELCNVERLNLLQLAPGGHLGRFVIWTQAAFEKLSKVWGSNKANSSIKKDYVLPTNIMTNSDLTRLINSEEVQTKVRPAVKEVRYARLKKNPLKNFAAKQKLNPYAAALRRSEILAQQSRQTKKNEALLKARKAANKKHGTTKTTNYARISFDDLAGKNADTWEAEQKAADAETSQE